MTAEMKKFFEENHLAIEAAKSLKDGREIALVVSEIIPQLHFTFFKKSGKNILEERKSTNPEIIFTIPESTAGELLKKQFTSIGEIGVFIFEKMLSSNPKEKVQAKLCVGILTVMAGGYMGILSSGGAEVAKFLATKGLGNLGRLKDALSKLKG